VSCAVPCSAQLKTVIHTHSDCTVTQLVHGERGMAAYTNSNSYTTQHQYSVSQYSGGPGEQSYHTHTTKSMGHHQAQLDEVGCPVVSSTSPQEHEAGLEMRGCSVRQHDNIGSIITMLIADQSVDLEDILTDGIRAEEIQGGAHTHTQTQLQDTVIKEETDGLGLEYTGYSPDYSLYQRDYVAQSEEPVGECRSRSLSSLSSSSEGDEETQYRTGGSGYSQPDTVAVQARIQSYSGPHYTHTAHTPRTPHTHSPTNNKPGEKKDEKYWERRRKNNLAAKKSRDARRVRENQLRLRVLCLENANRVLREQMDRKHLETVQLRERLSKYESVEEICPENTSPPKM